MASGNAGEGAGSNTDKKISKVVMLTAHSFLQLVRSVAPFSEFHPSGVCHWRAREPLVIARHSTVEKLFSFGSFVRPVGTQRSHHASFEHRLENFLNSASTPSIPIRKTRLKLSTSTCNKESARPARAQTPRENLAQCTMCPSTSRPSPRGYMPGPSGPSRSEFGSSQRR